ncbi:TetR family transcriptional regulator [Micromonospora sp. RTGN7]|uniref:TetR family transcriptional regulator n=1 Tax=Micromonospora sp. RTGN7 TaxID=3016526 RepID=UPI0029FF4B53|nr:TetR family transcriptional regulator [Micromonospora sp. RTGN7]
MTTTDPPRRRAPGMTPDHRRAAIVRAALPLLATHGAAVTTAQVARAAGIGEATVFRAFTDKQALLDACLAEALRPDTVVDRLAEIPMRQPLADRLTEAADTLLAHLDRIGAVLRALHVPDHPTTRSRPDPGARARSTTAVRDAVTALLAPDADRLRLPTDRLAELFIGLLPTRDQFAGGPVTPAELVDVFLRGALSPGAAVSVTLNHTIVPAVDHHAAARFFADVMGLSVLPPAGRDGHFAPVRVNDQLTLDFASLPGTPGHHLAFDVDPDTFDAALGRLREAGVSFGDDPRTPDNGGTDHPLCPRGLFFGDDAGNLYELMSPV